jgi:four helix bundle protein
MFIAHTVAIELIHNLREVIPAIKPHDRDLADQIHRAATSVALNLSEGARFAGGNKRRHFEIAQGSASEVKSGLDVAEAWGWIADATVPRHTLDRLLALLWKLTHPKRV